MATIRRPSSRTVSIAALAAVLAFAGAPGGRARADDPPSAPKADEPKPVPPLDSARTSHVAPVPDPTEVPIGDEVPVVDVLRFLAKTTQCSITWSDQDKAITSKKIRSDGTVFRVEAPLVFDAVRALLSADEIVLVPVGPASARMYRAMDARMLASQFILKAQPEPVEVTEALLPTLLGQGGRFVVATIRVKHLTELRDARTALQRIITQNNIGSVQEVPAARAFVVTDFAPNVAAIWSAIQAMDVPPAPLPTADASKVAPAYFALKHAKASKVAYALQQLFREEPAGAPRAVPTPQPAPGAVPAAPSRPAPRITADEDANQVIVIATAEDATTIADVVRHMDIERAK